MSDLIAIVATFAGCLLVLGILTLAAWMLVISLHPESYLSRLLIRLCPPQQRHSGRRFWDEASKFSDKLPDWSSAHD